jgi:N-acetylglutamate synthase-like GNAT family acetyltransferase
MIKIEGLEENKDLIPLVSKWLWDEWGKEEGRKLEHEEYIMKHSLEKDDIPQTFVAFYENVPCGTVSIWRNDLSARQDLFPWLSCLYVSEDFRRKRIGNELITFVINKAKKMGFSKLYLMTKHTGLYEKRGWTFMEEAPLMTGSLIRLYKYDID